MQRFYEPQMIRALRETLSALEQSKTIPPDDPTLVELKTIIRRKLSGYSQVAQTGEMREASSSGHRS